ncbi:MAG: outer membrane lipoprotein carrier protein LolA [Bryobacterales bacterium]|jgi:outer membrane lipoprotein carrier protein|nr:outer membrane lipoprotein carrier protein LolA [Bryobacterales bacterium]
MRHINMQRARKWIAAVALAVLWTVCGIIAGGAGLGAQTRISPILQGIESRYNAMQTLQVEFTQVFRFGPRSRTEQGVLYLRKPGRMRWEYSEPSGKVFLSDGKYVYLYSPSTQVVERSPFKATDDLRAPLAFLLGKLDFQRDFARFTLKPEGTNYWITAEPKNPKSPYSMVSFLVSPNYEIVEVEVTGMDQAVNRFRFRNEQRNVAVTEAKFAFQPPAGTRLVEAEQ